METSDVSDALFLIEGELEGYPEPGEAPIDPPQYFAVTPQDLPPLDVPFGYDEAAYLRAFPDVARAVGAGERRSGLEHYLDCGQQEGRLSDLRYLNASAGVDTDAFPAGGIDALFATRSGRCLVIGWLNDDVASAGLEVFIIAGGTVVAAMRGVARCRREDAEAVVFPPPGKLLGFWTVLQIQGKPPADAPLSVAIVAGSQRRTFTVQVQRVGDDRLRELALEYLATSKYFANPQVEATIQLEGGLGQVLIDLNVMLSSQVIASAYCMRFGPRREKFTASVVVCLYGKAEFLFLQSAFFSEAPGYDCYEFIYVSNSPELAEKLVKEATLASRIYGTSITLVILPGNAGFGAANNVAVNFALSDRIMIVNPDVFPRNSNWARTHEAILAGRPADEVAMFGVPLYYDDGSLMHGGMFIDTDVGLSVRADMIERREMLRVEHYGKGAPPDTAAFLISRPVPAVTGAFISADRAWFELLGGFSLEYVFGHYEDADLCLKSFSAGKPVWIHNVPFWHLEGKGSTRRVVHEGGSTVNRWHFTRTWGDLVADGMRGQNPARLPRS